MPVAILVALALLGFTGGFGGLGSLGQVFAGPGARPPVAATHDLTARSLPVVRSSSAAAPKPAASRAGHASATSAKTNVTRGAPAGPTTSGHRRPGSPTASLSGSGPSPNSTTGTPPSPSPSPTSSAPAPSPSNPVTQITKKLPTQIGPDVRQTVHQVTKTVKKLLPSLPKLPGLPGLP